MTKREKEAPELGEAVVRMMRALVKRAEAGDTEALEVLARIEQLAPAATTLALHKLHTTEQLRSGGYSFTQLGAVLGISRQAARQRAGGVAAVFLGAGHVLIPGHRKRECVACAGARELVSA